MTGERTNRSASCRVVVPDVPDELRANLREVVDLHAEEPRQGHGTGLMCMLCYEADRAGVVLLVHVDPHGADAMDAVSLMRWYAGFGFTRVQRDPLLMAREPVRVTVQ